MTREEEIRARCEAATPGPWALGEDADIKAEGTSIAGLLNTLNDAEFIAHAREDIPYLLDRLEFMTEAYDRNAKVHEALTRDYLAVKSERDRFKARAEAAERDIQQMLRSDETCDLCVFCKCFYDEYCGCSTGAEWRGPQEGANQ